MKFDMNTNLKASNKVLINIWRSTFKVRTRIIEFTQLLVLLSAIICIFIKDYPLAIRSGIIFCGCMIIYLSASIKAMRTVMNSYMGQIMEFDEKEFKIKGKSYQYSQIKSIIEEKDYLIIRLDKVVIPVIKKSDNKQQITDLLKLLYMKCEKF